MENKQEALPHIITFLKMDNNPITHKDNTIILLDGRQLNFIMEASFGFDADRAASVITLKLLGNVIHATAPQQQEEEPVTPEGESDGPKDT